MNSFPDEEVELSYSQIGWYQVLFLIQIANSSFRSFLNDHLEQNKIKNSEKKKIVLQIIKPTYF